MILPRRLMKLEDGRFCEEHDPRQAMNFRPKGFPIPDAEAEKIGLTAYLNATGWGEVADEATAEAPKAEQKAVAQASTEDKAMAQAASEDKSADAAVATEDAPSAPDEEASPAEPGPGLHIETEGRPRRSRERP